MIYKCYDIFGLLIPLSNYIIYVDTIIDTISTCWCFIFYFVLNNIVLVNYSLVPSSRQYFQFAVLVSAIHHFSQSFLQLTWTNGFIFEIAIETFIHAMFPQTIPPRLAYRPIISASPLRSLLVVHFIIRIKAIFWFRIAVNLFNLCFLWLIVNVKVTFGTSLNIPSRLHKFL